MASLIAFVSSTTSFAFVQPSPIAGEGVILTGPLGSKLFWEDGSVDTPPYDGFHSEKLEEVQKLILGWKPNWN